MKNQSFGLAVKRLFDLSIGTVLLLAFFALGVLCALAIKLDSRGPVFYRCRRVGQGGRDLSMLKFRKMRDGARGSPLTEPADPRFTRVGRFLARTKLDELPQLWNVLRGEMSLIGPRPEDPHFVQLHAEEYSRILEVKPGMTGLAQLVYVDEGKVLDPGDPIGDYLERVLPEKIGLDSVYAARRSFGLDLRILIWTVVAVVLRRSLSVDAETGAIRARTGRIKAPAGLGAEREAVL